MSGPTPRLRALLQFAVTLAIAGVLWAVLLDSLHTIQEQSERTVMEATVRNMNSGLRLEIAARIMHGEEATLPALVGNNPVNYLEKPPLDYLGPCTEDFPHGKWCFDERTREIAYRPRREEHLAYPADGRRDLRWRIASAAERAGTGHAANTSVGAITLVSTTRFTWR
jgi:general secretion pathway protein G